jgi:hypothetical protein
MRQDFSLSLAIVIRLVKHFMTKLHISGVRVFPAQQADRPGNFNWQ